MAVLGSPRRVVTVLVSILVLAVGGLIIGQSRRNAAPATLAGPAQAGGSQSTGALAAEAAAQRLAVTWVAQQVSRDAIVSCDPLLCLALRAQGEPAGDLLVLRPGAPDPLGSDVIVATAAVRSQFGRLLSSIYAPTIIASFATGNGRIDIRATAPDGASAYQAALSADVLAREAGGAQLLGNSQIVASAAATRQLATGQVDSRLMIVLVAMATLHPIHVLAFTGAAPGASPGVPLRSADLAETSGPGGASDAGYVRSMQAFLGAQRFSYRPAHSGTVRLADGQAVFRIEFAAPSPLGLLSSLGPVLSIPGGR